jgi:antitoxin (DNA-binding transcriptional repressor) of toxin-antitoxin stability system
MIELTINELQEQFDKIIDRVENGETIKISTDLGNFMIVPYDQYQKSIVSINCFCDHDDGC